MAYTKYSLTPADNNAAPPNGAPEGMLPSAVNDTMRDMMSQIRDVGDGIRGGTYTMTAPVITGGSITGVALSGNTFTSPVITGGSINNTPIGATTANTGAFTTLGATGVATFSAGTVSAPAITTIGDTNTGIFFPAADTIAFTEGGVESMRIDSAGNLGIGVTPSNAFATVKSIEYIGGAISGLTTETNFSLNSHLNSSGNWVYKTTAAASLYQIKPASFVWNYAASGTAGSAVSFTEAMRIDSAGNCGIGTSSPAEKFHVVGGSSSAFVQGIFEGNSQGGIALKQTGTNGAFVVGLSDSSLAFSTNGANERMRIDASGNLLVGTTSSYLTAILSVQTGNTNNGRIISNFYNSNASSTTRGANTLLRVASNASGADGCLQFTDSVANNSYFGQNNGGAYVYCNTGGVRLSSGGTSWASDSDERVKDIIEPITDAINKVSTLRAVIGKYKTDDEDTRRSFLIAQDVQAVLPEAVVAQKDEIGTLSLAYTDVIPLLVAAIKELKAELDSVKAELQTLKGN